jgi:AcrR family transcriptional regulator
LFDKSKRLSNTVFMESRSSKSVKPTSSGDSKDLLLQAAKHVFAEKGFEGSTVKDLADAAGVNVSLVSYYFGGKEGLYKSCLESIGQVQVQSAQRILKTPTSIEDFCTRLSLFAEEFLLFHLKQPDVCRILHRDIDTSNKIAMSVFHTSFLPMYLQLQNFIIAGIESGILDSGLKADITTSLLFGQMVQGVKMDAFRKELFGVSLLDDGMLEQTIEHIINGILYGLTPRNSRRSRDKE